MFLKEADSQRRLEFLKKHGSISAIIDEIKDQEDL
jgi:hypothetical protein